MLKPYFVCLLFTFTFFATSAQDKSRLPLFHVLKTDSTDVSPASFKKGRKLMVIYFSPDCSHCQLYTKELFKHTNELRNTDVLMVTWTALPSIRAFYKDFSLVDHPNFIVATELGSYNLFRFYGVKTTPFTAVYDQDRHLIKMFEKSPVMDSLMAVIKK